MSQLFSARADRKLRRFVTGAAVLLLAVAAFGLVRTFSGSGVGAAVPQPIAFSHLQHVETVGIECATCHENADDGRSAGMPSNALCLECHDTIFRGTPALQPLHEAEAAGRQVPWRPVSALPGFAHFHHGMHARAGASCVTCHGDVASMERVSKAESLSMDFCVDCHRDAQQGRRDGIRLVSQWRRDLTDCSVCHY